MFTIKLTDYPDVHIERGIIIRCKGIQPYEKVVDFLVCESYDVDKGFLLIVASGYKAGLILSILPKESIPIGFRTGLSRNWLIDNWNKWGYTDCLLENAWLVQNIVPIIPHE